MVAGLQAQVTGVHPVGGDRDERLARYLLVAVERLERGGLAGRVAVEDEDQLAAVPVVVHHQPPQQRQVPVAERRAARGDGGRLTGQVHRHDVGVALDDHRTVGFGDVAFGQIEAEEHRGLLVQDGFGGVDVLGFHRVVVEDPPGPEADHLAAPRPDRPQQPAMKAIHRAAPPLPGQPGRLELLELETLAQQVLGQRVPPRRCEAAPEPGRRLGVEVPVDQVLAGRAGLLGGQGLGVELLRRGVGRQQPAAAAPVTLDVGRRAARVGDGVADAVGEQFDGLDERDVFDLLEERVHVTTLTAPEAVEVPVVGPDVERRRLFVMEGAQPLEGIGAGPAQLDVVADHVLDVDPFTDGGDVAVGDPAPTPSHVARHPASLEVSAGVTTRVPAVPGDLR